MMVVLLVVGVLFILACLFTVSLCVAASIGDQASERARREIGTDE